MSNESTNKPVLSPSQGPSDYPTTPPPDRTAETSSPITETRGGLVKRAMEKAADGLNRSISLGTNLKSQLSQSQPSLPVSTHRRIFSLNRAKGKEQATEGERLWPNIGGASRLDHRVYADEQTTAQSQQLSPTSSLPKRAISRALSAALDDDSPFITPRSPSIGPTRPVLSIFRGDGSVSEPQHANCSILTPIFITSRCVQAHRHSYRHFRPSPGRENRTKTTMR